MGAHLHKIYALVLLALSQHTMATVFEIPDGPYAVGTTSLEIAKAHKDISAEEMESFLIGARDEKTGEPSYLNTILGDPSDTLVVNVKVPNEAPFDSHAGDTLPLVMYVVYPTTKNNPRSSYRFPYDKVDINQLPHMQRGDEKPIFENANKKYPLIVLSHGIYAHAIYDIAQASRLASHGYIVVTMFYGDGRMKPGKKFDRHRHFLRPLMTSQALDYLLSHEDFKDHIDENRIGASGHSLGGYTLLAMAGGDVFGQGRSLYDPRIKTALVSAPWVGGTYYMMKVYGFGKKNRSLKNVHIPILGLFGTKDKTSEKSYVLTALTQTSGPRHIIELVDQPHIYEGGSWQDQEQWAILFFDAYLKGKANALKQMNTVEEAKGGNEDRQLFEYRKKQHE